MKSSVTKSRPILNFKKALLDIREFIKLSWATGDSNILGYKMADESKSTGLPIDETVKPTISLVSYFKKSLIEEACRRRHLESSCLLSIIRSYQKIAVVILIGCIGYLT